MEDIEKLHIEQERIKDKEDSDNEDLAVFLKVYLDG